MKVSLPALTLVCTLLTGVVAKAEPSAASPAAAPLLPLPGAPAFPRDLRERLNAAKTHIASTAGKTSAPKYINRLALESSPYLLQHAFNPVNWYPWGDEAFNAARESGKPIFLSIGYSTCHWCHVMEHESFENEAVAEILNREFIAIKVDREERPDIDEVYMTAVIRLTGSGGWPLSVFLTADRRPFYGGTYFPPEDAHGLPGFAKLLRTVAKTWQDKRDDVVSAAENLAKQLDTSAPTDSSAALGVATLRVGYDELRSLFDAQHGGFGRAPKFPQAHQLQFLLRYWQRTGETQARSMVELTLRRMAAGGIFDQLGGGFHRYSTDTEWRVPHYEKMLYDQAIHARAYLEAAQATGDASFGGVARRTFDYVLRDLTAPQGGFYSAEDADSEGEEGRFYTWTRAQLGDALGQERGNLVADYYGVPPTGAAPLHATTDTAAFAEKHSLAAGEWQALLEDARSKLIAARQKRARPFRDEKILTAWNGLMISSLAYGSSVLGEPQLAVAAARAADFILSKLQRDGALLRRYRNGSAQIDAYLDDYAAFTWGLIELYDATLDARWLAEADRMARQMLHLFLDADSHRLRFASSHHERLVARSETLEDNALPSANSLAVFVLLRLGHLLMNEEYTRAADAALHATSQRIAANPATYAFLLSALDFSIGPRKEIVIAGAAGDTATRALLAVVRHRYLPRAAIALHQPGDTASEALIPFLKQQPMLDGRATAYVCERYVCALPTHDPSQLDKQLAPSR